MKSYQTMAHYVVEKGQWHANRTGIRSKSVFGYQFRHDMSDGFPLLTTKRVFWKGVVEELLWFLRGSTDATELSARGVNIWNDWTDEGGELGPIYGYQWRTFGDDGPVVDQIRAAEALLISEPESRRNIVSAWNPNDLKHMALPPCHMIWQLSARPDNRLSMHMCMRSADLFLGVPFNIASYALLLEMFCATHRFTPGDLVISFGDLHIYENHVGQIRTQMLRDPRPLPQVELNSQMRVLDYTAGDIKLVGYNPHGPLKGEVAV